MHGAPAGAALDDRMAVERLERGVGGRPCKAGPADARVPEAAELLGDPFPHRIQDCGFIRPERTVSPPKRTD